MSGVNDYPMDLEILVGFVDESSEGLTTAMDELLVLGRKGYDEALVQSVFRVFHSIKGNSAFFGLFPIKNLSHVLEQVLDKMRKKELSPDHEVIDTLLDAASVLIQCFSAVREGGIRAIGDSDVETSVKSLHGLLETKLDMAAILTSILDDLVLVENREKRLDQVMDRITRLMDFKKTAGAQKGGIKPQPPLPGVPADDLPADHESGPSEPGKTPSKTMRVSEAAVDQFLAYVGELVVVEEMYSSLELQMMEGEKPVQDMTTLLRKTTEIFKGLSRQLQRSIMEIRKVPVGNLFQRMPKIVHDVAREKNKAIDIRIENSQLLVDKTLIEKMEAPLVHMVRNAADHGIEIPEVRKAMDKPEQGTIVLSAEEAGETITVTLSDDGAGLNLEKIRAKAVELGILDPKAPLSEDRIIDVMFHSGVSTAEEVSDISGRGVGMDVVKKNIQEAGGSIKTRTEAGKGTTFTLTLPSSVTTQIIQGFIVRTGSKRCIIPLDTVNGSLSLSSSSISTVKGRRRVLNYNNRLIPLTRLQDIIDPDGPFDEETNGQSGIIVITQVGGVEKAYVVDAVEGIRQVVVKPIHDGVGCETRVMSGGAVMGDGTVALILDMESIMRFSD